MKTIEMKGSFIVRLVKMLLGLCRFELDQVKGIMGRLAELGFKPKGSRVKAGNKKPIL
jgi:hypothetical protein